MLLQMIHKCANLSLFFEVFLFYETAGTKSWFPLVVYKSGVLKHFVTWDIFWSGVLKHFKHKNCLILIKIFKSIYHKIMLQNLYKLGLSIPQETKCFNAPHLYSTSNTF